MAKLWFKAKRYGYGWYPVSWQGWAVTLLAIAIITVNSAWMERSWQSASAALIGSLAVTIVTIALLIIVCVLKGEKARWRWGGK